MVEPTLNQLGYCSLGKRNIIIRSPTPAAFIIRHGN